MSMSEGNAPLTEDAAIAAIEAFDKPQAVEGNLPPVTDDPETPAADPEAEEVEPDPDAEIEAPENEEGEEEPEDEGQQAVALEAPQWWDAEAKAAFNDIPNTPAARDYARKIQQYVAEAEAKRETVTQKVKADAAQAQQAANQQLETMKAVTARLEKATPGEIEQFQRDYGDIEWSKMPQWAQENPAAAASFFATYNARKANIESLIQAQAAATKAASDAFASEQSARLREIAPDLAQNHDTLVALGEYALNTGIGAEALNMASADELVILNKARLWDEAQAKAAAAAKAPKNPTPPPKTVKPVGAQVQGTHAQRTYSGARDKVMKSRSDDDAVAAILAGGF
jgi:hypothetical protein